MSLFPVVPGALIHPEEIGHLCIGPALQGELLRFDLDVFGEFRWSAGLSHGSQSLYDL